MYFSLSLFFFGGSLQCFCLSSGFILLDSMSPQSPVPFPPGPIEEHKDGGRQGILRSSSDTTDIDITSVIIKPKLSKWIANLRGLSHSILVCACLHAHTLGACEIYCDDKILSQVVCFSFFFLPHPPRISSFLSSYLSLTIYTKIQ